MKSHKTKKAQDKAIRELEQAQLAVAAQEEVAGDLSAQLNDARCALGKLEEGLRVAEGIAAAATSAHTTAFKADGALILGGRSGAA